MQQFLKHIHTHSISISIGIIGILVLALKVWALPKGIGVGDESWFLYLLKHQPTGLVTQFHLVTGSLFKGDILLIRGSNIVVSIFAAMFFMHQVLRFFSYNISNNIVYIFELLFLATIALFIFDYPATIDFSYNAVNRIVTLFGVGFLVWSFRVASKAQIPLLLIAGICIGMLIFIKITNSPIIGLCLAIIICVESTIRRKLLSSLWFFCGVLLYILYYFLVKESFSEYLTLFTQAASTTISTTEGTNYYTISFFLGWIFESFKYMFLQGIPFFLVFYFYEKSRTDNITNSFVRLGLYGILLLYFVFIVNFELRANLSGIATHIPFIGILAFMLYTYKGSLSIKQGIIVLGLFLLTFMLPFGTLVSYKNSGAAYIIFVFPLVYMYLKTTNIVSVKYVFIFLLMLYGMYFYSKIYRENWTGIASVKQVYSLQDIGIQQNISVDEKQFAIITDFISIVPQNVHVTTNYYRIWAYPYLQNCIPLDFNYNLDASTAIVQEKIMQFLKTQTDPLYFIESFDFPLSESYHDFLSELSSTYRIEQQESNYFRVYIVYP